MSRVVSDNLVLGVQWESLLGLDKEAREIRDLATRRKLTHFVVVEGEVGTESRSVGLVSLPLASEKAQFYALASVLTEMIEQTDVLFLHDDPSDPNNLIFLTLKEGKPEHDQVLTRNEALDAARKFLIEVDSDVVVAGKVSLAPSLLKDDNEDSLGLVTQGPLVPTFTRSLTLNEISKYATRQSLVQCRFAPVKTKIKLNPLVLGGLSVVLIAGVVYWFWPTSEPPPPPPPDPVAEFNRKLTQLISKEPLSLGVKYAENTHQVIGQLPSKVGDWKIIRVLCQAYSCSVVWRREKGGTFSSIMNSRENAHIRDAETAIEELPIPKSVAAALPTGKRVPAIVKNEVVPVSSETFFRTAGSRFQTLKDYGMDVVFDTARPLVAPPSQLAKSKKALKPIAKGSWKVNGHLAFLDSVSGVMHRSNNMTLNRLEVNLEANPPVFAAQGAFYVE